MELEGKDKEDGHMQDVELKDTVREDEEIGRGGMEEEK